MTIKKSVSDVGLYVSIYIKIHQMGQSAQGLLLSDNLGTCPRPNLTQPVYIVVSVIHCGDLVHGVSLTSS